MKHREFVYPRSRQLHQTRPRVGCIQTLSSGFVSVNSISDRWPLTILPVPSEAAGASEREGGRRILLAGGGEMSQPTALSRWGCVAHHLGRSTRDSRGLSYVSSGKEASGHSRILCCRASRRYKSHSSCWCAELSCNFPIIAQAAWQRI